MAAVKTDNSYILCINGGSSSIKFALFGTQNTLPRILQGAVERIGLPDSSLQVQGEHPADSYSQKVSVASFDAAVDLLHDWLDENIANRRLSAIGHRVVHGGPDYSSPQPVTAQMLSALQQLSPFDPEHLPNEIRLIEALQKRYPDLLQVACFDTAFHHTLPRVASMLPIPRRFEAQGVRRYGFHGLSYAYLLRELATLTETRVAAGRVILAHLGNGASLAAVQDGKPIDTSMCFTPTAGVPMGTRSGDLDPGLFWYLVRREGLDGQAFNKLVNNQSGLLGVSEISADMQVLLEHEAQDKRAAEAIALFCYQVKKWLGSYAAALGGLDTLVFAGGIGENAPSIRARICAGLGFLGIELDAAQNRRNAALISTSTARVAVRVIHTDEARMMAESVAQILNHA